jgi:hypothetical protein
MAKPPPKKLDRTTATKISKEEQKEWSSERYLLICMRNMLITYRSSKGRDPFSLVTSMRKFTKRWRANTKVESDGGPVRNA